MRHAYKTGAVGRADAGGEMTDEPIQVPSAGEPEWTGEITEGRLDDVISGLLVPNQGFAKAMARKLRAYMRKDTQ